MITPSQILASAELLAATDGGAIDESVDRLTVSGCFDAPLLEQWHTIASAIDAAGVGSLRALDSIGDEVDLVAAQLDDLHGSIRIIIEKRNSASVFFVYSPSGLAALLGAADQISLARSVYVAKLGNSFITESCTFSPWINGAPNQDVADIRDVIPSPRRIVKDVAGGEVPVSLGPFLLVTPPPAGSMPCEIWQHEACRQMLLCLVNEVWLTNGDEVVVLAGPRTRRIPAGLAALSAAEIFSAVTECARWVFASGRDVEVRHTLFTYELAREWPDTETLANGFLAKAPRALDSAKTAFHAHIRETSKDTLKALGDLRKTLSEEVTKVVQQTRDLLSGMWRDFAFAATALAARIALLLAEKPAASSSAVKGLIFGTAIFLAFSLYMTLRSNAKFMLIAADSRKSWRDKLYGFLPEDDLKKLADDPLRHSESEYMVTRRWVIGAYIAMIGLVSSSIFWPGPDQAASGAAQGQQPKNQAQAASQPVAATRKSDKASGGASAVKAADPPSTAAKAK
nr:hypothetical protein [uncultured Roseateles sp.]